MVHDVLGIYRERTPYAVSAIVEKTGEMPTASDTGTRSCVAPGERHVTADVVWPLPAVNECLGPLEDAKGAPRYI